MLITIVVWLFFAISTLTTATTTIHPQRATPNITTPVYSTWESLVDVLIPTSPRITNARCRLHSILFRSELKKFTLWATEMFDSSAKFPNGVLQGSTYEFGNFDECVQVRVPQMPTFSDDFFAGKYCLADVTLDLQQALDNYNKSQTVTPINSSNWNASTWEHLVYAAVDRRQRARNEFHWAICIPSSCTGRDLEIHLQEVADAYNKQMDIKLSVKVTEKNCQIYEPYEMTLPQAIYISIISVIMSITIIATIFEYVLMKTNPKSLHPNGKAQGTLLCFSMITNMKKLVLFKECDDKIQGVNGIKVISMFCVIMGHRFMFVLGSPLVNPEVSENLYRIDAMVFMNGPIIVDTFFCISGFLSCYLLLKEFNKRGNNINFPMLYIHRILRISAVYIVVIGFYCLLFSKVGSGPMWQERIVLEEERCKENWWLNLLFVNNYFNTDKICMFQSWYIACDIHYFLITPPLVWLLFNKPTLGITTLGGITLLSVASTFLVTLYGKLDAILLLFYNVLRDPTLDTTFIQLYIPSHTRATPYLIGMIAGYMKYKMPTYLNDMPKCLVSLGWIMAIGFLEGMVYSAYIFYMPTSELASDISAYYAAFHHLLWSVGISWFVVALSTGHGNLINPILSWKPFVTLSRITYGAFLFHGGIQLYTAGSIRVPFDSNVTNLLWMTMADITSSYIGGLCLSVFFESPVLGLEKVWFQRSSKSKRAKVKEVFTIPTTEVERRNSNCCF